MAGTKTSGKRGTKYMFPEGMKNWPIITWRNKRLEEMDTRELRNATRYLVAGWQAALSLPLLVKFCGLDEEQIAELKRRDPQLESLEEGAAERLVAIARVNLSHSIENGNVKDSRWLLEHVDAEFARNQGSYQQVVIPVAERERLVKAETAKLIETIEPVEFENESTESTAGE